MPSQSKRISPAAKSKGKAMKKDLPGEGRSSNTNPTRSRAQRNDTPEAAAQRDRSPKTHPTRAPGATRKDRSGR